MNSSDVAILMHKISHLMQELSSTAVSVAGSSIASGNSSSLMVFLLSCIVGYYVISNVSHSLHAPLMSVTNAISSVVVVGAMISTGQNESTFGAICGAFALFLLSINIAGGFLITKRMLEYVDSTRGAK